LSVPIAEPTTPAGAGPAPVTRAGIAAHLSGGRLYAWLGLVSLVIAALSLLIPSTPSYDPWAWLVWGREILHANLHTPGGPTWKPLPVIFTTVLGLFGHAQPDLWLVIARAGAILSVLMVFALAARLTWRLRDAAGVGAPGGFAISAVAGLIGLVSLAFTGEYLSSSALGYSEGLMVAAMLIAVDRHLDGRYRTAFAVGFVAALDRPEVWLFWGAYGLWLMWRDPGSRALVLGLAAVTLFLWFVPQKWGGGSWFSGVTRAQHPRKNSPAFAPCPFCAELKDHAWPLVLLRIKVFAALAVLAAIGMLWRGRVARPGWRLTGSRDRTLLTLIACGLFGLAWWVLVALETQGGFSGNDRYLVLGSAFIVLAGAVGFGWLAHLLVGLVAGAGAASRRAWAAAVAAALIGLLYVFGPNFVGSNLIDFSRTHRSLIYQATLRKDVSALIASAGGARRVLACGPVMTEGFQVPMVAWYLGVRTIQVLDQPVVNDQGLAPVAPGQWPATILQTRDTRHAALLPLPETIIGWEHQGAHYRFTRTKEVFFFQDCSHAGSVG